MRRFKSIFGRSFAFALTIGVIAVMAACAGHDGPEETATPGAVSHIVETPEPGRAALRCEECEPAKVMEVLGTDTLLTDQGQVRLYGVFVAPESELCVAEATARLTELAGDTVRLEEGPQLADSHGVQIRYVYTEAGDSIDELLISEGTARLSSFDGQHTPWLLFQSDQARIARSGCIWEEYNKLFPGR